MNNKGSLPGTRWVGGVFLLFVVYICYAFFANVIDNDLLEAAQDAGINQYGETIIRNTAANWWIGIFILACGFLLYIVLAGMPGQTDEEWQKYI